MVLVDAGRYQLQAQKTKLRGQTNAAQRPVYKGGTSRLNLLESCSQVTVSF